MSYRRLNNRVNETTQTSWADSDPEMEEEDPNNQPTESDDDQRYDDAQNDQDGHADGAHGGARARTTGGGTNTTPPIQVPPELAADQTMVAVMMMMQQMQNQHIDAMAQMQSNFERQFRAMSMSNKSPKLNNVRPPKFDLDSDKDKFLAWKDKWGSFLQASGIDAITNAAERKKMAKSFLWEALSMDTIRWVRSHVPEADRDDPEKIIRAFEVEVLKAENNLALFIDMLERKQAVGEPYSKYATDIHEKSKFVNFEEITDIRDWLVAAALTFGLVNPEARKKVLREEKISSELVHRIARQEEKAAAADKKIFSGNQGSAIAAVSSYKATKNGKGSQQRGNQNGQRSTNQKPKCGRCGNDRHKDQNCPADGKECGKCHKVGHFMKVCRSKFTVNQTQEPRSQGDDSANSLAISSILMEDHEGEKSVNELSISATTLGTD